MDTAEGTCYPMPVTNCDHWMENISAMADGEESDLPPELVLAHARSCATCTRFAEQVGFELGDDDASSHLIDTIVARNVAAQRSSEMLLVSALLAIAAVAVIAYSIPPLLFGDDGGGSTHAARHLGAFQVAFAVALLVAAWRPARARSILPVAVVLVLAILLTTAADVITGNVSVQAELLHLPELITLPLVWLLATPPDRWPGRGSRS